MKELMLYIHIPFCERKCDYCDFLSAESTQLEREDYVETLCKEIMLHKDLGQEVSITSIFFGGGTPSILTGIQITTIMETIKNIFPHISETAEISLELNPGTATLEKLHTYIKVGINRLSIGLQATNNDELKALGRIHTYEVFLDTYRMAREVGFKNINVDLMSAIPGQTVATWGESLNKIIELEPEHISAYSLIIEEGTSFHNKMKTDIMFSKEIPSEENEREMYHQTLDKMKKAGYERYEFSNYSKIGNECKHNLGYWERKWYLGLGLGASSLIRCEGEEVRTINHVDYEKYQIQVSKRMKPIMETEIISKKTSMEEFIFLGLRKTNGINIEEFKVLYGITIVEVYGQVCLELIEKGLLIEKGGLLVLTELGIDISNEVLSYFV